MGPLAPADGHDFPRLNDELVPGVTAEGDDNRRSCGCLSSAPISGLNCSGEASTWIFRGAEAAGGEIKTNIAHRPATLSPPLYHNAKPSAGDWPPQHVGDRRNRSRGYGYRRGYGRDDDQ